MRIVTWNCRRGPLATKRAALSSYDADILVLTEASRPAVAESDVAWFGERRFGVAVIARPPFRLAPVQSLSVPCVYPISVVGPESFTLLAVWTWAAPTYRQALLAGLHAYAHLPTPWVVAGDFNGNVCFDRPRQRVKWRDSFELLESVGLVSAYHTFANVIPGQEPVPTHYFLTHRDRPFHIDYCYIPAVWVDRLVNVSIAPFEEFASLSDHRPVSIAITPNAEAD
jgi:exodeoxyribonuclease-3